MLYNNIPILYGHSVAPKSYNSWVRNFLTLELSYFEEFLKYLKRNEYQTLFLDEYYEKRGSLSNSKQKYVCLTFDDGFLDNYVYAFPILKKYGYKATIFVNPEFVDSQIIVRKTLLDYWNNKTSLMELDSRGYLSWEELRFMKKSGFIDIQSHTMTHTKYFVSDKIIDLHHPGVDCLYPIGNLFHDRKPYYITDPKFEKLIPYGYPYFEEQSAIIARRIFINPDFTKEVVECLKNWDWYKSDSVLTALNYIQPIYDNYRINGNLIVRKETLDEYKERVRWELKSSKEIIERELETKVEFCCWPHGDNNEFAHQTALSLGYKATTIGKFPINGILTIDRLPERIGLGVFKNSRKLSLMRLHYKIKSFQHKQPYSAIRKIYEGVRYGW